MSGLFLRLEARWLYVARTAYDATGGRRACVAHTTLDEERGRYVHRKSRTRLTCRRLPHIEQFLDRHDLGRN